MLFQSIDFIIYLVITFLVYWSLPFKYKKIFLVLVSYFFYCYIHQWFFFLLFTQTTISFFIGILLIRISKQKKKIFVAGILSNLVFLLFFKYFNFFVENINAVFKLSGISFQLLTLEIILPIGISFYTFQNIGYLVDVYRGNFTPTKNFIDYNLFISFFPKLIAGPIERADNFLKQITIPRIPQFDKFINGFQLILWGFFKKVVIADNIAVIVNKIFLLKEPDFFIVAAGAFAFTIQILADFSGYTDIARGIAKLFGYDLLRNFNKPYLAKSPSDFWRRWHMSLSEWIRDYIYIPLGGSRVSTSRWVVNLFITFFIVGLWHGASWNYVIWGLYYWVLYLVYRFFKTFFNFEIFKTKYNYLVSIPFMFLLTNIGWLLFREVDINYLIQYMYLNPFESSLSDINASIYLFIFVLMYTLPLVILPYVNRMIQNIKIYNYATFAKYASMLILLISILLLKSDSSGDFIYFQF